MYGGLFMNTITIDNNTYNSIVRYAQQNNISVSEAVVTGLNSFLEKFKEKVSTKEKYYIPRSESFGGWIQLPSRFVR